jgi:hypothetical protein
MIILRFICKMFHEFWGSGGTSPNGIDSHRWESKVEILRSLSS